MMLLDDDFDPKTKRLKPRSLDKLSIDDLKLYIGDLQQEIARAEADIVKKQTHMGAAASLFKKKDN